MATNAVGHDPADDKFAATTAPKHGDLHQDVEAGAEMVDIERIEKVYA